MKEKILRILREADGYVSGQSLCEMLGVSRTAVWKNIGQLRAEGYQIEAVTNKGYRLEEKGMDVLNEEELNAVWNTRWAGRPLIYKKETGSSNDDIMKLADEGYPQGTLVVTSCQTAGKGRRGRIWLSPPEGNVYMSILLRPHMPANKAPQCTLVCALALYQAAEELPHGENVIFGIKWPNDLVVSVDGGPFKKIVGILTEMRMEETEIRDVTIGVGVNVNMPSVPEEVQDTATTMMAALGYKVTRAAFTASCWRHFEDDYDIFEQAESFAQLKAEYEKALVNIGRKVRVLDPRGEYMGEATGITDNGELIVIADGDGSKRHIGSGEISVRGVMGYV